MPKGIHYWLSGKVTGILRIPTYHCETVVTDTPQGVCLVRETLRIIATNRLTKCLFW